MSERNLFERYDVPVPRYTSYPTVPFWSDSIKESDWLESLKTNIRGAASGWSTYFHLPFCETLCSFCGCNQIITRNHGREEGYIQLLHKEMELYFREAAELAQHPLRQVHLGGGSPTFFRAENLLKILEPLFEFAQRDPSVFEGSIEADPRRTQREQLEVLRELGFNRISIGVQDFNHEVQKRVHRIQPVEMVEKVTRWARDLGYRSVNFDLIYGLPGQTPTLMSLNMDHVLRLRPDRIALYSLAVVPWMRPAQKLFVDDDLPRGSNKRDLYELARNRLVSAGYLEIGLDHFALPGEDLARAHREGRLHRNFMGYTDLRTDILVGFGVSAISESRNCFHQNQKDLAAYETALAKGRLPTQRGHVLSEEDLCQKQKIIDLMTGMRVKLSGPSEGMEIREFLRPMIEDELVEISDSELRMTARGEPFVRLACVALDSYMRKQRPSGTIFSSAI